MAIHTPTIHGISLCAGYGGLELGISIAEPGYRTVCVVEREAHAAATIVARMEDKALDTAPIWDDVKTFDGRPWRGKVHLLAAGYPCQPFSFAGRRKGKDDPRHLWPDVARIVQEVEPQICFFENVEGHINLGAAEVIGELQEMGFDVKAGLFSAVETGAAQHRRRLFIMAHANHLPLLQPDQPRIIHRGLKDKKRSSADGHSKGSRSSSQTMDAPLFAGKINRCKTNGGIQLPIYAPAPYQFGHWNEILTRRPDLQPELFGLANGLAGRVERSRAAGNGVASLVAAYAWRTLKAAFIEQRGIE